MHRVHDESDKEVGVCPGLRPVVLSLQTLWRALSQGVA